MSKIKKHKPRLFVSVTQLIIKNILVLGERLRLITSIQQYDKYESINNVRVTKLINRERFVGGIPRIYRLRA